MNIGYLIEVVAPTDERIRAKKLVLTSMPIYAIVVVLLFFIVFSEIDLPSWIVALIVSAFTAAVIISMIILENAFAKSAKPFTIYSNGIIPYSSWINKLTRKYVPIETIEGVRIKPLIYQSNHPMITFLPGRITIQ